MNRKANQEAYAYTGKAVNLAVTVKIGDAALTSKDYKVQYQNNKDAGTAYVVVTGKGAYKNNLHAGTATVTVTGKGNYAGLSATATFKINPQQIKKASLKGTKNALTLTYNKRTLKEGTDYETPVYGEENRNKVSVTITGKKDFTGTMMKSVKVQ